MGCGCQWVSVHLSWYLRPDASEELFLTLNLALSLDLSNFRAMLFVPLTIPWILIEWRLVLATFLEIWNSVGVFKSLWTHSFAQQTFSLSLFGLVIKLTLSCMLSICCMTEPHPSPHKHFTLYQVRLVAGRCTGEPMGSWWCGGLPRLLLNKL
jgi:hypothetical protein